ncbi:T9SS type A sorting domain-containing protein [Dokdonia sinensis]|nr:T9SS type A sorting domain-containing protein [Dokdonia sinensis]
MHSQTNTIQIRLIDQNIGYPAGDAVDTGYIPESNDDGLNQIFIENGATAYYPGQHYVQELGPRVHFVECNCDTGNFAQELNDYLSVVEIATISPENGAYTDLMEYQLLDEFDGDLTGNTTANGNLITTNDRLNEIFEEYSVYFSEQFFATSQQSHLRRIYDAACNCNVVDLKAALDAEPDIIESTQFIYFGILGLNDITNLDFKFYPNPVENNIEITTTEKIETFTLMNSLGQTVSKSKNINNLNQVLITLETGMYLLKITTTNQKEGNYRLVKK